MSKGEIQNLENLVHGKHQEREVDSTDEKAFTVVRLTATADFESLAKGGSYRTR